MTDTDSRPILSSSQSLPTPPSSGSKDVNNNNNSNGQAVQQQSVSPLPPSDNPIELNFRSFAKFGDSKSTGDSITLSNSDKWFKQAKVIDGKKITTVDTGIYFKKIAK